MHSTPGCSEVRFQIDAHFAGRAQPDGEQTLRRHVSECAPCHGYYERHLLLAKLDPRASSREDRMARALGIAPTRRSPAWFFSVAVAAAAASLFVFVAWRGPAHLAATPTVAVGSSAGMQTRGIGSAAAAIASGVRLRIYRVARKGSKPASRSPLPVARTIKADDELAFAYENGAGRRYVLVFAVDAKKRVHWYHPAWTDAAKTPRAVAITRAAAPRELPEAVRHPLRPGALTVYGLFCNRRIDVREVERALVRVGRAAPALTSCLLVRKKLEVTP